MEKLKISERGWAGHFCGAELCRFRRNTLLQYGKKKIIVSTVGNYNNLSEIGVDRYYETMAFYSKKNDKIYFDADVRNEINFKSKWSISKKECDKYKNCIDNIANEMHDNVVKELSIYIVKERKGENK